jgi:predicted metalloprotease with PDZ domain
MRSPLPLLSWPSLLLSLALACAGCRSTPDRYFLGPQDATLATRREPSGEVTTWRLETVAETRLRVVREFDRERADVGIQVEELGKEAAERRGVRPYTGMLVAKVTPDSPAKAAGLLANDVVLTIDGVEVVYREQYEATMAKVAPGAKLALRVLRGQQPLDVEVVIGRVVVRATEERRIDLDIPPTPARAFAGATLRGVPADVCKAMYGEPRQAVVVVDIEVGSPAWIAGVRSGDVIDAVDGAPTPDVKVLTERIVERGAAEARMRWSVRRGDGPLHEADIALHDYQRASSVRVPLLYCREGGVFAQSWSAGPFGLLMNSQSAFIPDKSTRELRTRSVFRAVFGLFRLKSSPTQTEVQLLWFVRLSL